MSNDYIELTVKPTRELSKDEWAQVETWLAAKGLPLEFRIPTVRGIRTGAWKTEGVGPKPKATAEEINQRIRNNLDKAVRDGDVEDARSWAGLLAVLG